MVLIMLLTATITYKDVQNICASLIIPLESLSVIWNSSFEHKKIVVEAYRRKDNYKTFSNDLLNLIKEVEKGKFIIYYAIQLGCDNLFVILDPLLPDDDLGIYHGGLGDKQYENIISLIHCVSPLSMTNLVQHIRRARRDSNEAKSVIFYSVKKDLKTNFAILAENREMYSNNQNMADDERERTCYLDTETYKIREVLLFCQNQYECCVQLINRYHLWNGDNIPASCLNRRFCKSNTRKIRESGLTELESYKSCRKPKFGKPKEVASYMLADLV
ncbi:3714_t:CDS:2, partial [Funneliformis caledonium]